MTTDRSLQESSSETPSSPHNYAETLFLPETSFPMRAHLPKKESEILALWQSLGLFEQLRKASRNRPKFVLHDGPPYANGHLHIGHALNKILKDITVRLHQMQGYNAHFVPGWDCHGLPIEWKVEEEFRAKGKPKESLSAKEFRQACRRFAEKWIAIQKEEFQRLGVMGDWNHPYLTMSHKAEATIARELLDCVKRGEIYRGSKPVMWSVVEKTTLAEAEVTYLPYESDTVWVQFPILSAPKDASFPDLEGAQLVIWTTTPWTLPGNRALSYSQTIAYGLYEVTAAENSFGPEQGARFVMADACAPACFEKAKLKAIRLSEVPAQQLADLLCAHPLRGFAGGYLFDVPLLAGEHVTETEGTGFVHTAPGHGREDFEIWIHSEALLRTRGIAVEIPFLLDDAGCFTTEAPGFEGAAVLNQEGKKGDANARVISALIEREKLFARGRLTHPYPHSWRSQKPVIFRNTPQWFMSLDKPLEGGAEDTLRHRALTAIETVSFVPPSRKNRLISMIQTCPDWVLSRQRAWGVPLPLFIHRETGALLQNAAVNARILATFEKEGADAWFAEGSAVRFLEPEFSVKDWEQVQDILDVWFDSGCTHAFVLEENPDLSWPADVYLEGSDQHRGWFQSSLLESCATRGKAPYRTIVTHGFTMDGEGRKMSKSLGNVTAPQEVIQRYGADILRLWVASSDMTEDQRIGPDILRATADSYRKLRNTLRWMLGVFAHDPGTVSVSLHLPEVERLILHQLFEKDQIVRAAYAAYDFRRVFSTLLSFLTTDLSAFYFDLRKDVLYCDPFSSEKRQASLFVIRQIFECLTVWFAPLLPFTMEEAWQAYPFRQGASVHLRQFPEVPLRWEDSVLARKWARLRNIRRVVTGALEIERREGRIGSSLEAAPKIYITDPELWEAAVQLPLEEVSEVMITSGIELIQAAGPEGSFVLPEVPHVFVVPTLAQGKKCARSWKIVPELGHDPLYPDVTERDAQALREWAERQAQLGIGRTAADPGSEEEHG